MNLDGLEILLRSLSVRIQIAVFYALIFSQTTYASETLYLSFDNSVTGIGPHGEIRPSHIEGNPSFATGILGAALITGPHFSLLRYPTENIVKRAEGTVAMWVKPIDWGSSEKAFHVFFQTLGKESLSLYKYSGNKNFLMLATEDIAEGPFFSSSISHNWSAGKWHHLAGTWSSSGVLLYLDGAPVANHPSNANLPKKLGAEFLLGDSSWSTPRTSRSLIDEVHIYDEALTPSEINNLFRGKRVKTRPAPPKILSISGDTLPSSEPLTAPPLSPLNTQSTSSQTLQNNTASASNSNQTATEKAIAEKELLLDSIPTFNYYQISSCDAGSMPVTFTRNGDSLLVTRGEKSLGKISFQIMVEKKTIKTNIAKPITQTSPHVGGLGRFSKNVIVEAAPNKPEMVLLNAAKERVGTISLSPISRCLTLGTKLYSGIAIAVQTTLEHGYWGIVRSEATWDNTERPRSAWINAPYGESRGFQKIALNSLFGSTVFSNKNIFSYGQSFNFISSPDSGHIEFITPPIFATNKLISGPAAYQSVTETLLDDDNSRTFTLHNYFSNSALDIADYALSAQMIETLQSETAGLKRNINVPIAGVSIGSQIHKTASWAAFANKVMPAAASLGFKRVWIGQIPTKGQQFPFEYRNKSAAYQDLKYVAQKAHSFGLEPVLWVETATANQNSALTKAHPDWIMVQSDGSRPHYAKMKDVLLIHPHSDYINWYQSQLNELKSATGINAFWLDSLLQAMSSVDYSGGYPKNDFAEVESLLRTLKESGSSLYGEAITPLAISSYWIQKKLFSTYTNNEFSLLNSAPYTNRPDSDFVDYFKAASVSAFPVIDIHPIIDGVTIYPNQAQFSHYLKETNGVINILSDNWFTNGKVVWPFEGGAAWIGSNAIAMFFYEDRSSVIVKSSFQTILYNHAMDGENKDFKIISTGPVTTLKNIRKYQVVVLGNNKR